jgi:tellurite resistance protein
VRELFVSELRPGSKPTKIDLTYKVGKTDDWERESFDLVKYSKSAFFSAMIGPVGIAALFRFTSLMPTFATPELVWKIIALLSLPWTAFFLLPYLVKCIQYPHKIRQEWMHPMMNNAFSIPWMTLVVYAFLADHYSNTWAKVFFWIGSPLTMLFAIIIVGNWLATIRHEGHVNGGYQMAPIGCFIVAVMGPIIDPGYHEVCFFWFGFALLMWITLFVFTFQRTIVGYIADPRGRMFSAIWMAAPAVGSIAWTVLTAARWASTGGPARLPAEAAAMLAGVSAKDAMWWRVMDRTYGGGMDPTAMTLFYMAVSMALVLAWMVWRRYLWTDQYFMQMWAWGFTSAALSWAAVLYDLTIDTALSKVLAVCLIALACIINVVLVARTCAGVLRLKVFIPEHVRLAVLLG